MPSQLIPTTQSARASAKPGLSFAFGRRFFLLLLLGLIWIGPAWTDPKFLYAMLLWDLLVLLLWRIDLSRLPNPNEIEIRRPWHSTLQLREPAEVTLEFSNSGKISILLWAQDEIPVGLSKEA